jgi:osmotically inducible protein OsmC
MATEREAEAVWSGGLFDGSGQVSFLSSNTATDLGVTWAARTEQPDGKTSPEELIAAAHASCFAMAFSKQLKDRGGEPRELRVHATSSFEKTDAGFRITRMLLEARGKVDGIDSDAFNEAAEAAKVGCPVSNALAGNVQIELKASLES